MLTIRMQRTGRSGHAQFRVIVQDSRFSPTRGRVVAYLGSYDPHTKAAILDSEKTTLYLGNGAQPSDRVVQLLKKEGIKLPDWVKTPTPKKQTIKHPEKLRRNRPADEPKKEAEEPTQEEPAQETPETPAEPADDTPVEAAEEPKEQTTDAPEEPAQSVQEPEVEVSPEAPAEK